MSFSQRVPRPGEAVEVAPLIEESGLRRVQVLRFSFEGPSAKGDRLACKVVDREDDAIAEPVVRAILPCDEKTEIE